MTSKNLWFHCICEVFGVRELVLDTLGVSFASKVH